MIWGGVWMTDSKKNSLIQAARTPQSPVGILPVFHRCLCLHRCQSLLNRFRCQPLTDATISFTDLKNGFGASAVVAPDGTFEVITLKGGMRPGTYSVAVMPLKPESPEIVSELQRQFSESHNGGMRDEETMMDSQGEPEDRPDRLSKEPEKEIFDLPATTIPFNYRSIQTSGISKEITEDGPNELLIELATIPG